MNFLDFIDDIIAFLGMRYYWRLYVGAASGFVLVIALSKFVPKESFSVFGILCCLIVPAILGGVWHRLSQDD